MTILLKKARIYDPHSPHHLDRRDILIIDGEIKEIAESIDRHADQVISSDDLCVSPGWVDVGAFSGEPGYEQRETLPSLKDAAARGGYTYVAPLPTTMPAVDSKASVQYLLSQNDEHPTMILPLSAATIGGSGGDMAELIDLAEAGAVASTDGITSHLSAGALMRILQYTQGADVHYIHYLAQRELIADGQIHEGATSVQLGLVGIPALEEEINLRKALSVADYLNTPLYIQSISTSTAVDMLREHEQTVASVPYLNLIKTDAEVASFDTNLKVLPPLRDADTMRELRQAIIDGTVRCISSGHLPQLTEDKDKEFGLAKFGATGLSTCFSALCTHAEDLPLERIVHCLSLGGYEMLRLSAPIIAEGEDSVLTIFDPTQSIIIDDEYLKSKCHNNPWRGQQLRGKVLGIMNVDQYSFFV